MFCPPPGSPGSDKKMGVIKKGGALQNEGIRRKRYNDKKTGAIKKSDVPEGARGGWGQNNLNGALRPYKKFLVSSPSAHHF